MRLTLLAVGRWKAGPTRDLFEDYKSRLLWRFDLKEVEARQAGTAAEMKRLEADKLVAAIPKNAILVALDERGESLDSSAFAQRLGAWRDAGRADIAFVIGGADGLAEEVRRRADLLLSFGRLTWPHLLVRGMLAEQLYRAQQILAGHPYHRDR